MLASADVLVHGSACETYGFVLVEALASGTPVVVPDRGGAAHLACGASRAVYSADADEGEIAQAIARVLDRAPAPTRAAARRAAERHPSRETHYEALFRLYEELLAARSAPRAACG